MKDSTRFCLCYIAIFCIGLLALLLLLAEFFTRGGVLGFAGLIVWGVSVNLLNDATDSGGALRS